MQPLVFNSLRIMKKVISLFCILYMPCNRYTYREMSCGWVLINTESKQFGMKQPWGIIMVFVQREILEQR